MAGTGYWPPDVPFTIRDLTTALAAINESRK